MKKTEQFCRSILTNIGIKSVKAFTNLVISLSSYESARSVVELSESPVFHHQYSSIRDGIAGIGHTAAEQESSMSQVRDLGLSSIDFSSSTRVLLQTDASSVIKAHSSCLSDRQYVKTNNNVISSNKPISTGYPISLVNISPGVGKWSIPIDICRINSTQSASECAAKQINHLVSQAPLSDLLVINTLDSGYGSPAYLTPVYEQAHLVNIVRFRYGKKVWLSPSESTKAPVIGGSSIKKGAPRIYGDCYYLIDQSGAKTYHRKDVSHQVWQNSIFDLAHQDYIELESQTSKGRALSIQIWRWKNLLIRSKNGESMKDKPFDLIASQVKDKKTGELVFNKTMFTTIHGRSKDQISTQEAFEYYRKRYDIEPSIKFAKQKLLLDKYQTPDQQHFDNWLVVVTMAFWLLFVSKDEVNYTPKKWRQYKEGKNVQGDSQDSEKAAPLTPNQVRQATQALFLTIDPTPFLPQTSNKGKGRLKGEKLIPRPRHPVVKKGKKKRKKKIIIEKIE